MSLSHALPKNDLVDDWCSQCWSSYMLHMIFGVRNQVWCVGKYGKILKFGAIRIPQKKNWRYLTSQEHILGASVRLWCRTWHFFLGFVAYNHYLGMKTWSLFSEKAWLLRRIVSSWPGHSPNGKPWHFSTYGSLDLHRRTMPWTPASNQDKWDSA